MDFGIGSVGDTINKALNAAEQAKAMDGKVVVCLCGTWPVEKDATQCPNCKLTIKNA